MNSNDLINFKKELGEIKGLNRPLYNTELANLLGYSTLAIVNYCNNKTPIPKVFYYAIMYFKTNGLPSDMYISANGRPKRKKH